MAYRKFYHVIVKFISFLFFGLGGLVFTTLIIPPLLLFVHPKIRRTKILRLLCSRAFALFIAFTSVTGVIRVKKRDMDLLREKKSCLVCANHPSLLDVVLLISLIPHADCIVKSEHWKNPFLRLTLASIYIPNSLSVDKTIDLCRESLEQGNNIILFPEGTRTVTGTAPSFKRSAAQIALRTNSDIIALHIECSEDSGLGKREKLWHAPTEGVINYELQIMDVLQAGNYEGKPISIAARQLTNDLKSSIFAKRQKIEENK